MKMLFIFLQSESLSNSQLFIFGGIVLALVAVLFFYFQNRINKTIGARKELTKQDDSVVSKTKPKAETHEEMAAAIALAIHMYKSDIHDQESFTITLKKVSKIYSPWSSKIYTLRQNPR